MARLCLFLLLPLLRSLASRLASRLAVVPAPGDSAGDAWRGAAGLPTEILRQVLELVPRLPVVAWLTADSQWRFVQPGTQQSEWVLDRRHVGIRFWPRGDRVLTWPFFVVWPNATVRDAWTGRPLQTLQHSAPTPGDGVGILDAQVCPAGDRLATLGTDDSVVVWDVLAGEPLKHIGANAAGRPRGIHWLGATQLAIKRMSSEGAVVVDIWGFMSDSTRHVLRAPRGFQQLKKSLCSSKLLTVGRNDGRPYHFCLWDIATGSMQWEWELEWDQNLGVPNVLEVIVSRGGARVVVKVSGYDMRLDGWMNRTQVVSLDGSTGEPRSRLWLGSRGNLVGLLAGGRHVAAINREEAAVWDTETGERLFALESDARLLGQSDKGRLAVSPCGQLVALCVQQVYGHTGNRSSDVVESLAVWDGRSGRMLFRRERRAHLSGPAPDELPSCAVQVAAMTVMADEFFD